MSYILQASEKNTKMQELNKFVHYYTRFKNHENSYKLEEPLLKTAKEKMLKLAEAVTDLGKILFILNLGYDHFKAWQNM